MKKIIMIALFSIALILSTTTFAKGYWFCYAHGPDDECGYSIDFSNKKEAIDRALYECAQVSGATCRIIYCTTNPPRSICGRRID